MNKNVKENIDKSLIKFRKALVKDIPGLLEVENHAFSYDQLSRRNFHWMIKHAQSIFQVIVYDGQIIGYGLVLLNRGTSLARLYSIALLKKFQGLGLASRLLLTLEELAEAKNFAYLRLEVKKNNKSAIKLYKKLGYIKFDEKPEYYEDGATAYCFEKRIKVLKKPQLLKIPYYEQQTAFTCGPACLMMAMQSLRPKKYEMSLKEEMQIWREATTIFMTSGHGGCGPRGLALSAWKRNFNAEIYLSQSDPMFSDSVRDEGKKKVIELVHEDFKDRLTKTEIEVHKKQFNLNDLKAVLKEGGVPIVLITTYHFDDKNTPHWVIVTAYDDGFVYIHDPDWPDEHEGGFSRVHIPIPEDQFLKISKWGSRSRKKISATVVVFAK